MPPEFPPAEEKEKLVPISIRLKAELWERIDAIATKEKRSRNSVVEFFLEWACNDYDAAQERKKKR